MVVEQNVTNIEGSFEVLDGRVRENVRDGVFGLKTPKGSVDGEIEGMVEAW